MKVLLIKYKTKFLTIKPVIKYCSLFKKSLQVIFSVKLTQNTPFDTKME